MLTLRWYNILNKAFTIQYMHSITGIYDGLALCLVGKKIPVYVTFCWIFAKVKTVSENYDKIYMITLGTRIKVLNVGVCQFLTSCKLSNF